MVCKDEKMNSKIKKYDNNDIECKIERCVYYDTCNRIQEPDEKVKCTKFVDIVEFNKR